jgi:predicted porin
MKKTILAMAITGLFATTAQATNVYDMDGVKVDLFGDAEVQYVNDIAERVDDKVIRIKEANFGFDLGYDIGNGLTVGGLVKFGAADDEGQNTATLSDAYVGISSAEWGTLTAGKTVTIFDGAGIGSDYEFGYGDFYEQDNSGEQVVKYQLDKDMFYGGVAYLMSTEADVNTNGEAWDANLGARFAGFDVAAFFGQAKVTDDPAATAPADPTHDVNNYVFNVKYQIADLGLAASYGVTDDESVASGEDDKNMGVTATYQLDKARFAAGYAVFDVADQDKDVKNFYVNASYAFTGNVNVYAEIGGSDADNTETGYAAGMEINF